MAASDQERQTAAGVTCCVPIQAHSPSGLKWVHGRTCQVARGQVIRPVFPGAGVEARRRASQQAETARTGVVVPLRQRQAAIHPACKSAAATGEGEPCSECSWRMGLDNEGARFIQAKIDEEGV